MRYLFAILLLLVTAPVFGDSDVVTFSKTEQNYNTYSYSIQAVGVVSHLVCDLVEVGVPYNVYQNGVLVSGAPFVSTSSRCISFETPGGGNFIVSKGEVPSVPCAQSPSVLVF